MALIGCILALSACLSRAQTTNFATSHHRGTNFFYEGVGIGTNWDHVVTNPIMNILEVTVNSFTITNGEMYLSIDTNDVTGGVGLGTGMVYAVAFTNGATLIGTWTNVTFQGGTVTSTIDNIYVEYSALGHIHTNDGFEADTDTIGVRVFSNAAHFALATNLHFQGTAFTLVTNNGNDTYLTFTDTDTDTISATNVSFENLELNGEVGTATNQVAYGSHGHTNDGAAVHPFDQAPTNDATDGFVIKATVVSGDTNWYYAADDNSGGGGAAQSPWTNNVAADGNDLTQVNLIDATNITVQGDLTVFGEIIQTGRVVQIETPFTNNNELITLYSNETIRLTNDADVALYWLWPGLTGTPQQMVLTTDSNTVNAGVTYIDAAGNELRGGIKLAGPSMTVTNQIVNFGDSGGGSSSFGMLNTNSSVGLGTNIHMMGDYVLSRTNDDFYLTVVGGGGGGMSSFGMLNTNASVGLGTNIHLTGDYVLSRTNDDFYLNIVGASAGGGSIEIQNAENPPAAGVHRTNTSSDSWMHLNMVTKNVLGSTGWSIFDLYTGSADGSLTNNRVISTVEESDPAHENYKHFGVWIEPLGIWTWSNGSFGSGSDVSIVTASYYEAIIDVGGGGGGGDGFRTNLTDLADVDSVAAPTTDDALIWNGSAWSNAAQAAGADTIGVRVFSNDTHYALATNLHFQGSAFTLVTNNGNDAYLEFTDTDTTIADTDTIGLRAFDTNTHVGLGTNIHLTGAYVLSRTNDDLYVNFIDTDTDTVPVHPFDQPPTNDATDGFVIKATVVSGDTNWYYAADDNSGGGGSGAYAEGANFNISPTSTTINAVFDNTTNSAIGGGLDGVISNSSWGVVGGGYGNTIKGNGADANYNVIAGGRSNFIGGWGFSVIGGGDKNSTADSAAEGWNVIGGGLRNAANGNGGVIGGGLDNSINTAQDHGTVAGGEQNDVNDDWGAIVGGFSCVVNAQYGITGGNNNEAAGIGSICIGGADNYAYNTYATISGGARNDASGIGSTVSGGADNACLSGNYNTVGGGLNVTSKFDYATCAGGADNSAEATGSAIPGGLTNRAYGVASFAAGQNTLASHDGSFHFRDNRSARPSVGTTTTNNFFVDFQNGMDFPILTVIPPAPTNDVARFYFYTDGSITGCFFRLKSGGVVTNGFE